MGNVLSGNVPINYTITLGPVAAHISHYVSIQYVPNNNFHLMPIMRHATNTVIWSHVYVYMCICIYI